MKPFSGFRNCKNCLRRYKGNGGQKYCSNECKRKFPIKKLNAVAFSVMELVEKGANSHEEIAEILKLRRLEAIEKIEAEIVATGNIGCQVQLQTALKRPVVHTVELLDWATGGPSPPGT